MITPAHLPFQSRLLTRKELSSLDVQLFYSPKCQRLIQLVGGQPALAFALFCEFDPRIVAYVERPLQIRIGDRAFDVSLWLKRSDGEDCHVLFTTESTLSTPGWHARSDAALLRKAAGRNGVRLHYVWESRILAHLRAAQECIRILPLVQGARRLSCYRVLRERIRQLVERMPHCNVSQLVREFQSVEPRDVRAVICDLIHGGVLQMDGVPLPEVDRCLDGGARHD